MSYDYDIIFLGGGLNYAGAVVASKAGLKCALIEKNPKHLGGTCLHNGCIPSKMYLEAVNTIRASKKSHFKGKIELDIALLDEEKEALLAKATASITKQCSKVDIIGGEGALVASNRVKIDDKEISAKYIIIGTGSKAFIPEGIEYDSKGVITSDDVLNLKELPKEISIYGDGAIGLEMASFFASAGVKTELIYRHDKLLKKAHPLISTNLQKQLEELNISLRPNSEIKSAKTTSEGVKITFKDNTEYLTAKLLVATGRRANLEAIKSDEIEINQKGIVTNEHFETTLENHYAIGDCNGKLQLAHLARAEVLYVIKRILGKNPEVINLDSVVKFIHTLPCSYANIGKTKTDLEKDNKEFKESLMPLNGLPFAITHDGANGLMVVYADSEGFIVGSEIFAPNAEELIAIVAMALAGEMDINTVKRTILAHPTFSESLEKAFGRL